MELTGTVDMSAIRGRGVGDGDSDADEDDVNFNENGEGYDARGHSGDEFSGTNMSSGLPDSGGPIAGITDAESFLNMLLQSNAVTQDTSLLDNILSQFESTQQLYTLDRTAHSAADADFTRVGALDDQDDDEARDTTVHVPPFDQDASRELSMLGQSTALQVGEEDGDDDEDDEVDEADGYEDAVTMDLTGVISRPPYLGQQAEGSEPEEEANATPSRATRLATHDSLPHAQTPAVATVPGVATSASIHSTPFRTPQRGAQQQATPTSMAEMLESLLAANPLASSTLSRIAAAASQRTLEQTLATVVDTRATPIPLRFGTNQTLASPASQRTPQSTTRLGAATQSTPMHFATPKASSSRLSSATPLSSRRSSRGGRASQIVDDPMTKEGFGSTIPIEEQMPELPAEPQQPIPEPSFQLDPLPPVTSKLQPPFSLALSHSEPPSLTDHAKAAVVFGIFDAYRQQRLTPESLPEYDQQASYPIKYEPLYRKAKLTARLEYCSSLASLFEVDRGVSQTASVALTDFAPTISYFEGQNDLLAQRKEELLMRISKIKQRLMLDAPNVDAGGQAGEIKELKAKLGQAKTLREVASSNTECLSSEIQAMQTTSTSFDRLLTEKKSAQNILLAINGLQLADVSEDRCDFVYDKFAKLHLDTAAEFASLHPHIDWVSVIRDSTNQADPSMRKCAISAMKTNAAIKELLEDVKRVKRHTFIDLSYNDGIQVRIQFFSKEHRRRFHLQLSLGTIGDYRQLFKEVKFDWATDVVYGDLDSSRLESCLQACQIDSQHPLLSIYQHIDRSMDAF
ncbi:hypothetical protein EV174_004955 [Coemansia sp. RSA 2320]|nr:hypothetical protein EV174_004955 [Coemansia sp. RSA 2320]